MNSYLDLSNRKLTALGDLSNETHVTQINLMNNELEYVYLHIFPPNILELSLEKNDLNETFDNMNVPTTIEKLNLSNNYIKIFDGDKFNNLTILNVSHNNLTEFVFPPNIQSIDLSHNALSLVDNFPKSLVGINLDHNILTYLPVLNCGLKILWCQHNKLRSLGDLPYTIDNINASNNIIKRVTQLPSQLINLDLSDNGLEDICKLPMNIETLNLEGNYLTEFPELSYGILHINVKNNNISFVESSMFPKSIGYIDISDNNMNWIDEELVKRCSKEKITFIYDDDKYKSAYSNNIKVDEYEMMEKYYSKQQINHSIYDNGYDENEFMENYYKNQQKNYPLYNNDFVDDKYNYVDINLNDPLCVSIYNTIKITI